jgi:hypothetical protein
MTETATVYLVHGHQASFVPFQGTTGVVVPLNAYAMLDPLPYGWLADNIRLRFGAAGHAALQSSVNEAVATLSAEVGTDFVYVAYEAAQLISIHEYWRLVYARLADDYVGARFFSDRMPDSSSPPDNLDSLMLDFRLRSMAEVLPDVVHSPHGVANVMHQRDRRAANEVIDQATGLVMRVVTSLNHRWRKVQRRRAQRVAPTEAVVLTQRAKSGRLLSQFSGLVAYTEISTDHVQEPNPPMATGAALTCDDLIRRHVEHRLVQLSAARTDTGALVDRDWRVLITDQEHDPFVRLLIGATLGAKDKSVIATPEGAQSLMGLEIYPAAHHVWVHDERIVRCCTSQGEARRMAQVFGGPIILSGYLAEPPVVSGRVNRLARWVLAGLVGGAAAPGRPLVLVNVDNEPDVGVSRPGVPSMAEKLDSLQRLTEILRQSGTRYVVTCKSDVGRQAVKVAAGSDAARVFTHIPWRLLMAISSVVIQRDSSLGPEAVAGGYPTIVWDDLRLPLASREWLEDNQPWVQYCTDESSLLDALDRISRGVPRKERPQLWDLTTPDRQVAEWIVADRSRQREARSD